MDFSSLKGYLNCDGIVTQRPAKLTKQIAIVQYIIQDLAPAPTYTEQQINAYIQSKITIEDYAVIRRHLVDLGYLSRTADGRMYVAGPLLKQ